jgi:hypothetical protein
MGMTASTMLQFDGIHDTQRSTVWADRSRRGGAARVVLLSLVAGSAVIGAGWLLWPHRHDARPTSVRFASRARADRQPTEQTSPPGNVTMPPSMPLAGADHGEPVAAVPGLQSLPLVRSLSEAIEKVDVQHDEWPVEVFNQQAAEQLGTLSRLIATGKSLRPEDVQPIIAPDFVCESLRPPRLQPVFADPAITVLRPVPASADNKRQLYRGASGLISAAAALMSPFAEAQNAKVHLKIYRAGLTEDAASTTVSYQAYGQRGMGVLQQNATWRCEWTRTAEGQPPRISSVALEDFEEIVPGEKTPVLFADCTEAVLGQTDAFGQQLVWGIDHWRRMLETSFDPDLSGFQGISVGDVNGDGLDDVYVCQQGGLPNRLFLQRPTGTLADVSSAAGVDFLELTSSSLLIDLDNDGDQDLALATLTAVLVLANDGTGKFTLRGHIPAAAALQSMSAADYDLDGDVDLYACGYTAAGSHLWKGEASLGAPLPYYDANNGGPNLLLRNDGNFRLQNVTAEVGLDQNNRRFSFAASWEDYDNDGDPDLYVANDFGRNNLYRNDGGHFVDVAEQLGVEDMATGMSASWGDYNNDGWMDLYVGNMFSSAGNRVVYQRQFLPSAGDETRNEVRRFARGNSLFQGSADGSFHDVSESAAVTNGHWAWASPFVDINNDGWEDLVVANGFITQEDPGDL